MYGIQSSAAMFGTRNLDIVPFNILDYGAVGDGTTRDEAAFASWKIAALAAQTATNWVFLTLPRGYNFRVEPNFANAFLFRGLQRLRVIGPGATLTVTGSSVVFLGGDAINNSSGVDTNAALIASAGRYARSVILLDPGSDASKFTAGRWALVVGLDMQGLLNADFGYPPNPAFHDYAKIVSVNATTGNVVLDRPLTNNYSAAWPKVGKDPGPATLVPLPANWDLHFQFYGFTVSQSVGMKCDGRHVDMLDMTFTGSNGFYCTQNKEVNLINYRGANCLMENDKIIDKIVMTGGNLSTPEQQSSSIKELIIDGVNITTKLAGMAAKFTAKNMIIPIVNPASINGYGRAKEVTFENTTLGTTTANTLQIVGTLDNGLSGVGINNVYDIEDGVILVPKGSNVTGAANNGAGKVRLTVNDTTGFITGKYMRVAGVGGVGGGISVSPGLDTIITVIDGTHVDLSNVNFSGTYTSGGLVHNVNPQRWAIDGVNCWWQGAQTSETGFYVTGVTEAGGQYRIATNLTLDDWPSVDLTSGKLSIVVHPIPETHFSNVSMPSMPGLNNTPDGEPIFSYWDFTYDESYRFPWVATPVAPYPFVFGNIVSITVDIIVPYTGSGTCTFKVFSNRIGYEPDYTRQDWTIIVDTKSGPRTVLITPSGVTGGPSGNDSGLSIPGGGIFWVAGSGASPHFSKDISADNAGPLIRVTIVTDQGVFVD